MYLIHWYSSLNWLKVDLLAKLEEYLLLYIFSVNKCFGVIKLIYSHLAMVNCLLWIFVFSEWVDINFSKQEYWYFWFSSLCPLVSKTDEALENVILVMLCMTLERLVYQKYQSWDELCLIKSFFPPTPTPQTHRGVWPYHLWVCQPFPERLFTWRSWRRGCGSCVLAQVK